MSIDTNLGEGDMDRASDAAAGAIPVRADVEDLVASPEQQGLVGGKKKAGGS